MFLALVRNADRTAAPMVQSDPAKAPCPALFPPAPPLQCNAAVKHTVWYQETRTSVSKELIRTL